MALSAEAPVPCSARASALFSRNYSEAGEDSALNAARGSARTPPYSGPGREGLLFSHSAGEGSGDAEGA